ncbi:MAG: response regulator [Proteobacteria bacterium]|nr:response regulator [Pseudomonadota bacterium]
MLLLLITTRAGELSRFALGLGSAGEEVLVAESAAAALDLAASRHPALVIADETMQGSSPLAFVGALLKVDAMINTAVLSPLSETDFHEESEGLGVLTQVPMHPTEEDGKALVAKLRLLFP